MKAYLEGMALHIFEAIKEGKRVKVEITIGDKEHHVLESGGKET